MKIAFVIPRYCVPKAGGAEILVQNLAERVAKAGHEVHVLTTTAQDHTQWNNELPAGRVTIAGVSVERFPVDTRKNLPLFSQIQQRLERGWTVNEKEERSWMAGSVHSRLLYSRIRELKVKVDAFIFAPYLFGLTCEGVKIAPEKSFMIPCLHDEPYAHLKIFRDLFSSVKGVLFNSEPEKKLGRAMFDLKNEKCSVVGMGFDPIPSCPENQYFGEAYGFREPYLLYVGRKEKGKNVHTLVDYFLAFKKNIKKPLKLVLLGSGDLSLPTSEEIIETGYLSQDKMVHAYRNALVTCQPSKNESFSIVLMESWLQETPVLVHARCPVTQTHVIQSQGGLCFDGFYSFAESLNYLLGAQPERKIMGPRGRQYVLQHFQWSDVLRRFYQAIGASQ